MDNGNLILLIVAAAYFLPAIVAGTRRHRQRMAIGVLNLLLGWTCLGWVAALVWACTSDIEAKQYRAPRQTMHDRLWSK